MKMIERPSLDFAHFLEICIKQTKKNADKQHLMGLIPVLASRESEYLRLASTSQCGSYNSLNLSPAEKALVERLYELRMQNTDGEGRFLYNEIRTSAKVCPYCGFGEVYEVDHFLPQSLFPELNIFPRNLTPICHPCNHIKRDKTPLSDGTYFLHPYFDNLPKNSIWLLASIIIESKGPVVVFCVDPNKAAGQMGMNLCFHFRELSLYERLASKAAQLLIDMQHDIDSFLAPFGPVFIQRHFASEAVRHFSRYGNSLEAAVYSAASQNKEYYSGSYRS